MRSIVFYSSVTKENYRRNSFFRSVRTGNRSGSTVCGFSAALGLSAFPKGAISFNPDNGRRGSKNVQVIEIVGLIEVTTRFRREENALGKKQLRVFVLY